MAFQPSLFPDYEISYPTAIVDAKVSSKTLLRHLYAVRRLNSESVFLPALNNLIDKVRNFINLSDTQIEETVWALPNEASTEINKQAELLVSGAIQAPTQEKFDSAVDGFVEWGLKIGATV